MSAWNYAEVWEAIAEVQPDAPALAQGSRRLTWREFDRRADGVAARLLEAGLGHQDKVALYLFNCPEYLEATFATFKAALVPVNTNYRYTDEELAYLWTNADAAAVVFHGSFAERVAAVRPHTPLVRSWLWVDDGHGSCPTWAEPFELAASSASSRTIPPWGRTPDDLVMLYTGGTTGMPKGVMWRQDDLFAQLNDAGFRHYPPEESLDGVRRTVAGSGPGMTLLPACPLMHGTGGFTADECLSEGGRVVLLEERRFDPVELFDTIERESVNGLVIVGDPFARPMVGALDAEPDRWDLSSLVGIVSSGAMWSEDTKSALLRHHPDMILLDAFSSSEAIGMGASVSSGTSAARTAEFSLGPSVTVLDDAGRPVQPGSEVVGRLALGGRVPLGYYKDEAKTAATFPVVDGVRYSVPGDLAEVRADGSIHVLGRGSSVINTAGEKVFPEEVEEVLKTYPGIEDAVVVGVPDERFGETVIGVVEPAPGAEIDEDKLVAHVKTHLAGFKAPRRIRVVRSIGRSPNGKVDYKSLKESTARWAAT